MFRTPKFIILAAIALYAVALSIAWQQMSMRADRRMRTMLESAEIGYSSVIDGEIDAALRNVGGAIVNVLEGKCEPHTLERMQELAVTFNIDEINIVNRKGEVIGSNIPTVLGFDFNSHPLTREFMVLTNSHATIVSQPFRQGVANPDMICRYYGMALPDHNGFIQLGMSVVRLRQNMYNYTEEEADKILKDWHFSVVGWYERADRDAGFCPGKIVFRKSTDTGEPIVGRYFNYRGYHYIAFLPESYCYSQRNAAFMVTALVLGLLLFFFTYVLVRLAKASMNLEKMHAAAAARTAADLALARTIQMSALPSSDGAFMDHLEFSFKAETYPAREVGGDFYDFYHVSGGRIAFLVADVSGKGIPGAMFMMETKNILKNCLVEFADIAEAVTEANRRICASNKAELFVTAWIGVLDPKNGALEYVNAGHNRPFLRRANGEIEKVMGKGGRFLGMFEDAAYRVNGVKLEPGDVIYLYTDGITEAMNSKGEQFGEARFCAAFSGYDNELRSAITEFVGKAEPSDDMTGLMLRWNGEPSALEKEFELNDAALTDSLEFVRTSLDGIAKRAQMEGLNISDEIVSNIVNYSGAKRFWIRILRGFDRLELCFRDDGVEYNPLSHVDPDTHAAIEDRPIGGLGLVVVKRLADRVAYVNENGCNKLTVIKQL